MMSKIGLQETMRHAQLWCLPVGSNSPVQQLLLAVLFRGDVALFTVSREMLQASTFRVSPAASAWPSLLLRCPWVAGLAWSGCGRARDLMHSSAPQVALSASVL
jgi:hypothetical protein